MTRSRRVDRAQSRARCAILRARPRRLKFEPGTRRCEKRKIGPGVPCGVSRGIDGDTRRPDPLNLILLAGAMRGVAIQSLVRNRSRVAPRLALNSLAFEHLAKDALAFAIERSVMPRALLTLVLLPRPRHRGAPRVTRDDHSARVGSPTFPPWNAARLAGSQSSSPHSYRNRLTRQLVEALPRHPPSPLRERDTCVGERVFVVPIPIVEGENGVAVGRSRPSRPGTSPGVAAPLASLDQV
jgi:hypothetical protein